MVRRFFVAVLLRCVMLYAAGASLVADHGTEFSAAEQELISLLTEFRSAQEEFWSKLRDFDSEEEAKAYYLEHDPSAEFLPKLLDIEKRYRGENVGVDALRAIIADAARGGGADSPRWHARREALLRLPRYENHLLIVRPVSSLINGEEDPEVRDYLRSLAHSETAHPIVRGVGITALARDTFRRRQAWIKNEQRIQELKEGAEEEVPNELTLRRGFQDQADRLKVKDDDYREVLQLLEELAETGDALHLPKFHHPHPQGFIWRIDPDQPEGVRSLADVASAILFREQYLNVGGQPPEFEVELLGGDTWSLESHRGQVVVIQFSFTGCGPCERMYPYLQELQEREAERLSVLTIMRDESPDSSQAAVESGKFTWNIALDGNPGRITTQWAVMGFPEVYVLDQEGTIAAVHLRDDDLIAKVEELLENGG